MSSMALRSFLPQYWAPSTDVALTAAIRIMFCTNWICDASETADMAFCSILPSMKASAAATQASIRF